MKNLILIISFLTLIGCSSSQNEEAISIENTDVRLEFNTNEPNYDEIEFTYYDNATKAYSN